jgi:hypothetical protein
MAAGKGAKSVQKKCHKTDYARQELTDLKKHTPNNVNTVKEQQGLRDEVKHTSRVRSEENNAL